MVQLLEWFSNGPPSESQAPSIQLLPSVWLCSGGQHLYPMQQERGKRKRGREGCVPSLKEGFLMCPKLLWPHSITR